MVTYTDKSNPREEGFIPAHSANVSNITMREAGGQEPEAADHISSAIRKQRRMDIVLLTFFL